ncbi:MAG TPA: glycosyltransferase family 39 protein [Bryobacteraceae bacterium]|nr:glycosyltransferase family 39 protein [Bryobacteraceae bacterium]
MKSRRAIRSSKAARRSNLTGLAPVPVLALVSAAAAWFFYSHGWLLWYGDAEAHLNTARRIIDNQTPGYDQIGSVWLPLPHVLLLPFVRVDAWWHSGIAAAFPSGICFVIGGTFLFAAARRIFDSRAAAVAACGLAVLNPNLLYLQSTAMTEAVFFAALMALLYFSVRFRETQGWGSVVGAGIAACAGALTRYEGWFLIPFAAAYFWFAAKRRRWAVALVFSCLAAAGPLYWMANDWYLTGDPLDFYRGPWSARAIQGSADFPGKGHWHMAWYYYRKAAQLCAGTELALLALAGAAVLLVRRAFWPLVLLALPGVQVIWSMHSGVVPIFMPILWPFSWYNTRYGLGVLPLLALSGASLATIAPPRFRAGAAALVVLAGTAPWLIHPHPESWITWAESRANSEGRRAWMHEAAGYLASRYVPGSGIIASSGDDFSGIFREMGIPLRETFSVVNGLPYQATIARPDLFLWQEWAVVKGGDDAQTAVNRAGRYGIRYRLEKRIVEKYEPVIEIYRRVGGIHGTQ